MKRKRDLVAEILDKRKRVGRGAERYQRALDREMSIFLLYDHAFKLPRTEASVKREMLRSIAIGLTANLEGYIRWVIRDLIDLGEPFRANAGKLDDLRLEITTVLRMHSERVSAGELVAHTVPLSSAEDIDRHLSAILGLEYLKSVKNSPVFINESLGEADPLVWSNIRNMFADRHIACHEMNPRNKLTFSRAIAQWRSVALLMRATENLLLSILDAQ